MTCNGYDQLRRAARICGVQAILVLNNYLLVDLAMRHIIGAYKSVELRSTRWTAKCWCPDMRLALTSRSRLNSARAWRG